MQATSCNVTAKNRSKNIFEVVIVNYSIFIKKYNLESMRAEHYVSDECLEVIGSGSSYEPVQLFFYLCLVSTNVVNNNNG